MTNFFGFYDFVKTKICDRRFGRYKVFCLERVEGKQIGRYIVFLEVYRSTFSSGQFIILLSPQLLFKRFKEFYKMFVLF